MTSPIEETKHRYEPEPSVIEPKWQAAWDAQQAFKTPTDLAELQRKPKFYVLDMFPYPSGAGLHIGHPEGYTATDVVARIKRALGFNVLHPMGWDAFGLPAERSAVREGIHPAVITKRNVDNFRRQLKRIGFSYDWTREVDTTAPEYYRWTQWIFLKLHERGLAYMAEVPVNWCPALGTVLANEEVKDGKYVETGDAVERRMMKQWMLKIPVYAERLLTDLEGLDWPDGVKEMQRNWIGKSEGAEVQFKVDGGAEHFTVFTTRPDTLFGATYCVLAPEHALVSKLTTAAQKAAVDAYVTTAKQKTDLARKADVKDKTGVFTGAYAINPANGAKVPVWVADYVLASYGTGAIMAVPAHDERDHAFAKQFNLPIIEVVKGGKDVQAEAHVAEGEVVNSGVLDGLKTEAAKQQMIGWLEERKLGVRRVQYALRDWLFSRQRYWGEPFPIVHLEDGTIATIPEAQLPVTLPHVDEYKPTADGQPPLGRAGDQWLMVELPDGRKGVREINTMPQWAGSCWYYLRFLDPKNQEQAWAPELEKYWMPVDLYVGGVEHAVLHLLYSRFWHKVLFDCGYVSTKEPFQKLFNQGMILAYSFKSDAGKYYSPKDVEDREDGAFARDTGEKLSKQIEKMSKSRFNVVVAEVRRGAHRRRQRHLRRAGDGQAPRGDQGTYRGDRSGGTRARRSRRQGESRHRRQVGEEVRLRPEAPRELRRRMRFIPLPTPLFVSGERGDASDARGDSSSEGHATHSVRGKVRSQDESQGLNHLGALIGAQSPDSLGQLRLLDCHHLADVHHAGAGEPGLTLRQSHIARHA